MMVILLMPAAMVTLVTLLRAANQFYRAECITVSGFFCHLLAKAKSSFFFCCAKKLPDMSLFRSKSTSTNAQE